MITLALDTSTPFLALAATRNNALLFDYHVHIGRAHAEQLLPTIRTLLHEHGATAQDFSRIVTGIGPGSYTGVKIGLAAAQGLARGSGAVAHGFTSLACLVPHGLGAEPLTVLVSAGRGRFYAQTFARTATGIAVLGAPWRLAAGATEPAGNVYYWVPEHGVSARNLLAVRGVEPTLQPYYL
jgi:tRNA threonylcarbamoyl adenosine modification protein YeaZ